MLWEYLSSWYQQNARVLPWRTDNPDPYKVWLSEIMLQQTTVATVKTRYQEYLQKFPTIQDLAAASEQQVLTMWQGLGYYARARNLHKCAKTVVEQYDGVFPKNLEALKALPGIGDYTAAAIMAIAFNKPAPVLDGNIERVISRVFDIDTPLPKARPILREKVLETMPEGAASQYPQALMDLANAICTPKNPKCLMCPLQPVCKGQYRANELPVKPPKIKKEKRYATALWLQNTKDEVLIRHRPTNGLLGGMAEVPWFYDMPATEEDWQVIEKPVTHVFTHIKLEMTVNVGITENLYIPEWAENCFWWPIEELTKQPWPTLMKKVEGAVL